MRSNQRPIDRVPYFSGMTDSEFAEELYVPRQTEQEKADSLPIDDDDAFGYPDNEKWFDQ